MMRHRRPIILTFAVTGVAFVLLAAGCGGGGASPGIASVASPPTTAPTATSTTQGGSGPEVKAFGGAAPGGQFQMRMRVGNTADGAKFSACMRKHGVTNFPDPNGQGVIQFGSGMGIDPNSPTFMSARSTCQKLLPNGGEPTPQQQAQQQQQLLALSKCMRAHGIKDFPDPANGGIRIHVSPGSDLNPNNPQFQAARKACQGNLPFKAGGAPPATGKSGSGGG